MSGQIENTNKSNAEYQNDLQAASLTNPLFNPYSVNPDLLVSNKKSEDTVQISGTTSSTSTTSNTTSYSVKRALKEDPGYILNDKAMQALDDYFTEIDTSFNTYLASTRGLGTTVNVAVGELKAYINESFNTLVPLVAITKINDFVQAKLATKPKDIALQHLYQDIATAGINTSSQLSNNFNSEESFVYPEEATLNATSPSIFPPEAVILLEQAQLQVEEQIIQTTVEAKIVETSTIDTNQLLEELEDDTDVLAYNGETNVSVTTYVNPEDPEVQALIEDLKTKGVIKDGMSDDELMVAIYNYLVANYKYIKDDPGTAWKDVAETILSGGGDCEDLANLYASLCLAAGVNANSFSIYVSAGSKDNQGHVVLGYKDANNVIHEINISAGIALKKQMANIESCPELKISDYDFYYDQNLVVNLKGGTGKTIIFEDPNSSSSLYTAEAPTPVPSASSPAQASTTAIAPSSSSNWIMEGFKKIAAALDAAWNKIMGSLYSLMALGDAITALMNSIKIIKKIIALLSSLSKKEEVMGILDKGGTAEDLMKALGSTADLQTTIENNISSGMSTEDAIKNALTGAGFIDSDLEKTTNGTNVTYSNGVFNVTVTADNSISVSFTDEIKNWTAASNGFDSAFFKDFTDIDKTAQTYDPKISDPYFGGLCFKTIDFDTFYELTESLKESCMVAMALSIIAETLMSIMTMVLNIAFALELKDSNIFSAKKLSDILSNIMDGANNIISDYISVATEYNQMVFDIKMEEAKIVAKEESAGKKKKADAFENMKIAQYQDAVLHNYKKVQEDIVEKLEKLLNTMGAKLLDSSDPFSQAKGRLFQELAKKVADGAFSVLDTAGGAGKYNFNKELMLSFSQQMTNLNTSESVYWQIKDTAEGLSELVFKLMWGIDIASDSKGALLGLIGAIGSMQNAWIGRTMQAVDMLRQLENAIIDSTKAYEDAKRTYDAMVSAAKGSGMWGGIFGIVSTVLAVVAVAASVASAGGSLAAYAGAVALYAGLAAAATGLMSAYFNYQAQKEVLEAQKAGLTQDFTFNPSSLSARLLLELSEADSEATKETDSEMRRMVRILNKLTAQMWQLVASLGKDFSTDKGGGFQGVDATAIASIKEDLLNLQNQMLALCIVFDAMSSLNDIVFQVMVGIRTKSSLMQTLNSALNALFSTINDASEYQTQQIYAKVQEHNRARQQQLDLEKIEHALSQASKGFMISAVVSVVSAALTVASVGASATLTTTLRIAGAAVQIAGTLLNLYMAYENLKFAEQIYNNYNKWTPDTDLLLLEETDYREDEDKSLNANAANQLSLAKNKIAKLINDINFKNSTIDIGNEMKGINPVVMVQAALEISKMMSSMLALIAIISAISEVKAMVISMVFGVQLDSGFSYVIQAVKLMNSFQMSMLSLRVQELNNDLVGYNRMIQAKHDYEDAQKAFASALTFALIKIVLTVAALAITQAISNNSADIEGTKVDPNLTSGGAEDELATSIDALGNKVSGKLLDAGDKAAYNLYSFLGIGVSILQKLVGMLQTSTNLQLQRDIAARATMGDLEYFQQILINLIDDILEDCKDDPFVKTIKEALKNMNYNLLEHTASGKIGLNSASFGELRIVISNAFKTWDAYISVLQAASEAKNTVISMMLGASISSDLQLTRMSINLWEQAIDQIVGIIQTTISDYAKQYNSRVQAQENLAVSIAKSNVSLTFQSLALIADAVKMYKFTTAGTQELTKFNNGLGMNLLNFNSPGSFSYLLAKTAQEFAAFYAEKAAREKYKAEASATAKAKFPGHELSISAPSTGYRGMLTVLTRTLGDLRVKNAISSILVGEERQMEELFRELLVSIEKAIRDWKPSKELLVKLFKDKSEPVAESKANVGGEPTVASTNTPATDPNKKAENAPLESTLNNKADSTDPSKTSVPATLESTAPAKPTNVYAPDPSKFNDNTKKTTNPTDQQSAEGKGNMKEHNDGKTGVQPSNTIIRLNELLKREFMESTEVLSNKLDVLADTIKGNRISMQAKMVSPTSNSSLSSIQGDIEYFNAGLSAKSTMLEKAQELISNAIYADIDDDAIAVAEKVIFFIRETKDEKGKIDEANLLSNSNILKDINPKTGVKEIATASDKEAARVEIGRISSKYLPEIYDFDLPAKKSLLDIIMKELLPKKSATKDRGSVDPDKSILPSTADSAKTTTTALANTIMLGDKILKDAIEQYARESQVKPEAAKKSIEALLQDHISLTYVKSNDTSSLSGLKSFADHINASLEKDENPELTDDCTVAVAFMALAKLANYDASLTITTSKEDNKDTAHALLDITLPTTTTTAPQTKRVNITTEGIIISPKPSEPDNNILIKIESKNLALSAEANPQNELLIKSKSEGKLIQLDSDELTLAGKPTTTQAHLIPIVPQTISQILSEQNSLDSIVTDIKNTEKNQALVQRAQEIRQQIADIADSVQEIANSGQIAPSMAVAATPQASITPTKPTTFEVPNARVSGLNPEDIITNATQVVANLQEIQNKLNNAFSPLTKLANPEIALNTVLRNFQDIVNSGLVSSPALQQLINNCKDKPTLSLNELEELVTEFDSALAKSPLAEKQKTTIATASQSLSSSIASIRFTQKSGDIDKIVKSTVLQEPEKVAELIKLDKPAEILNYFNNNPTVLNSKATLAQSYIIQTNFSSNPLALAPALVQVINNLSIPTSDKRKLIETKLKTLSESAKKDDLLQILIISEASGKALLTSSDRTVLLAKLIATYKNNPQTSELSTAISTLSLELTNPSSKLDKNSLTQVLGELITATSIKTSPISLNSVNKERNLIQGNVDTNTALKTVAIDKNLQDLVKACAVYSESAKEQSPTALIKYFNNLVSSGFIINPTLKNKIEALSKKATISLAEIIDLTEDFELAVSLQNTSSAEKATMHSSFQDTLKNLKNINLSRPNGVIQNILSSTTNSSEIANQLLALNNPVQVLAFLEKNPGLIKQYQDAIVEYFSKQIFIDNFEANLPLFFSILDKLGLSNFKKQSIVFGLIREESTAENNKYNLAVLDNGLTNKILGFDQATANLQTLLPEALTKKDLSPQGILQVKDFFSSFVHIPSICSEELSDYLLLAFKNADNTTIISPLLDLANKLPLATKEALLANIFNTLPSQINSNQDFSITLKLAFVLEKLESNNTTISNTALRNQLTTLLATKVSSMDRTNAELIMSQLPLGIKDIIRKQLKPEPADNFTSKCITISEQIKANSLKPATFNSFLNEVDAYLNQFEKKHIDTTNKQTVTLIKNLKTRIDTILKQTLPPDTRASLQLLDKELERYQIYFSVLPESEYFLTRLVDAALDKNFLIANNPELQELFKLYQGYEEIAIAYIASLQESNIDIETQQRLMVIKSILIQQKSGYDTNAMLICLSGLLGTNQEQIVSNLIAQLKGKIDIKRSPKYYGAKNVGRT